MIELLVLWRLTTNIGRYAQSKGYKKFGYQLMTVLLWFSGEFISLVWSISFLNAIHPLILYFAFILGSALGCSSLAFLIVRIIPNMQQELNSAYSENIIVGFIPLIIILISGCMVCGIVSSSVLIYQVINSNEPVVKDLRLTYLMDPTNAEPGKPQEIKVKTLAIYLDFFLEAQTYEDIPLTFKWYLNGRKVYSLEQKRNIGFNSIILLRSWLHWEQFPPGLYKLEIWHKNKFLNSISFKVVQ